MVRDMQLTPKGQGVGQTWSVETQTSPFKDIAYKYFLTGELGRQIYLWWHKFIACASARLMAVALDCDLGDCAEYCNRQVCCRLSCPCQDHLLFSFSLPLPPLSLPPSLSLSPPLSPSLSLSLSPSLSLPLSLPLSPSLSLSLLTLSLPDHLLCWCCFHLKAVSKRLSERPEMFILRTQLCLRMYPKSEFTQEASIQHPTAAYKLHQVYFVVTDLMWRPKRRERVNVEIPSRFQSAVTPPPPPRYQIRRVVSPKHDGWLVRSVAEHRGYSISKRCRPFVLQVSIFLPPFGKVSGKWRHLDIQLFALLHRHILLSLGTHFN